ncbi:MAG TPA: PQQ-binding-like beta-propeller repeat protein, partial [bacterium]|nr:PQQ-binding-like beta-propeller repeat protein [bacterium]
GTVRTYNTAGGEAWTRRLPHGCDYVGMVPDSTAVIAVSRRGDVTLLAPTGEPVWKISLGVEAGRPDASRERVVVPSFDGVYCFGPDGSSIGVYDVGAPTVRAILGGKDGSMLLVQDAKRRVLLLDTATGDTRWELTLPEDPRDVSFAADGSAILLATWEGELERLDVSDVARATAAVGPRASAKSDAGFLEVASAPDETAAASPDSIVMSPSARWRDPIDEHGDHAILALPRGAGVVVLDRAGGSVELRAGGKKPAWSASHLGAAGVMDASATGELIAAGGPLGFRLFSQAKGEIANAPIAVRALAVAGNGSVVLVGAANARLHLFESSGRAMWDVPTPGFHALSISPDGMILAIVRGGTISVQQRGGRSGFTTAVGPDRAAGGAGVAAHVVALDDGIFYATHAGRVGLFAPDGKPRSEDALPPGFPVEAVVRAGAEIVVITGGGSFRLDSAAGKLRPLAAGPARRPDTRIVFGVFMDRLVEFRYDSKEIACLDPVAGAVVWKRAMGSKPQAISVSAEGTALAGIVGAELVLYDLVPGKRAAPETGSGSPPSETPPSFLEL